MKPLKILITILALLLPCGAAKVLAQTPTQQKQLDKITANADKYVVGTGHSSDSMDEAREQAKTNLLSHINTIYATDVRLNLGSDDQFSSEFRASSAIKLTVINSIEFQDKKGMYHCVSYTTTDEVDRANQERQEHIKDLILTAIDQEGKLNISGALKHYTWALTLLNAYQETLSMNLEGRTQNPRPWLESHIAMILNNINIALDGKDIVMDEDENALDPYTVNILVTYNGKPVSSVDLSYNNGLREVSPIHVKNGQAALTFADLANSGNIVVKVLYDYPDEGKLYDSNLEVAYNAERRVKYDSEPTHALPYKIKKGAIAETKGKSNAPAAATAGLSVPTAPITATERKTIDRTAQMVDNQELVNAMMQVEAALKDRKYRAVKELFTPEGWELFNRMTTMAKIRVSRSNSSFTVESSDLVTIGRGIPVTVTNGNHVANENIVFRFDKTSGKISSVAYALTKQAENDIFRDSQWTLEARYAMLQFMEDYQTAFALKRQDYIDKIFAEGAIIITGKFVDNDQSKGASFIDGDGLKVSGKSVKYTQHTKESYIKALEGDFKRNNYIQLVFEDADITKVATNGFVDHDVMWIQLKQHYNSSTYNDKGYLTLQIDLKPSGSRIHVRTWTPDRLDIDDLKQRFHIGF